MKPSSPDRGHAVSLVTAAATLAVVGWLTLMLLYSVRKAVVFDGLLYDGTFQLLNPLRRLDAGQRVGTDFQLFHGFGGPFLHRPIYVALGGTLQAAELARYVVSILSHFVALAAFAVAWGRGARAGVILTAALLVATANVLTLYIPGWSSYGVRTVAPMLAIAALLLAARTPGRVALGALGVALSLALGTDQGLALSAGVLAGHGAFAVLERRHGARARLLRVAEGAAIVVLGVMLFAAVVRVALGDGAGPAMRYWLGDVPANQIWLFGSPPHGPTDWSVVARVGRLWVQGALTAVIAWWSWRRWRRLPVSASGSAVRAPRAALGVEERRLLATWCALGYGVFSCAPVLGMSDPKYLDAGYRTLVMLLVGYAWLHITDSTLLRRLPGRFGARRVRIAASLLVATLGALVFVAATRGARFQAMSPRALDPRALHASWQAPRMAPAYELHLARGRSILDRAGGGRGDTLTLWSDFAGFLEYHRGTLAPSYDYLFHALGPANLASYLGTFDRVRPGVVQMYRKTAIAGSEWNLVHFWPFYERVLRDYAVSDTTALAYFWTRRSAALPSMPAIDLPVQRGSSTLTLPIEPVTRLRAIAPGARIIWVVDVRYEVENPWRRIPVLGQLPRFVVATTGARLTRPVSLSPLVMQGRFPIPLDGTVPPRLELQTRSLIPGATVRWTSIRVQPIALVGLDSLLVDF